MIEIISQGRSTGEAKTKCMAAEILLTQKISPDIVINVLNAIGGIYIARFEEG